MSKWKSPKEQRASDGNKRKQNIPENEEHAYEMVTKCPAQLLKKIHINVQYHEISESGIK